MKRQAEMGQKSRHISAPIFCLLPGRFVVPMRAKFSVGLSMNRKAGHAARRAACLIYQNRRARRTRPTGFMVSMQIEILACFGKELEHGASAELTFKHGNFQVPFVCSDHAGSLLAAEPPRKTFR